MDPIVSIGILCYLKHRHYLLNKRVEHMKDTFTIINNVKERIEKTTSIPVYYILFLFILFLIWQPEYIDFINATKWVPMPIQHLLLGFANFIYAKLAIIMTTLIIALTSLHLAFLKTNFFYDLFFFK